MNLKKLFCSIAILIVVFSKISFAVEGYEHEATGLSFPNSLADIELSRVTDYESQHEGLGVGILYRDESVRFDIYLYTNNEISIPEGVQDMVILDHFEQVINESVMYQKMQYGLDAKKLSQQETTIGGFDALEANFEFNADGKILVLSIYLMGYHNHFFKIRFSYDSEATEKALKTLEELKNQLAKILRHEDRVI